MASVRKAAFVLLLALVFAIPWETLVTFEALGTLTRVLGMAAAGLGVAAVVARAEFRPPGLLLILIATFVLWNGLSLFWTVDAETSRLRLQTYAQLAALVWLIWEFGDTPAARRALAQAYVLGAYVSVTDTIWSYASGSAIQTARFVAGEFDPNDLGLTLALGIPLAWHLMLTATRPVSRLINGAYLPTAALAVLLTGSRGALAATIVASTVVLGSLLRLPFKWKAAVVVLLAATVAGAAQFVPPATFERLAAAQEEIASGDLSGRGVIWRAGLERFEEHPMVGIGTGAFRVAVAPYLAATPYAAHNTYLGVLVEQGAVGFGILAAIGALVFSGMRRLERPVRRLALVLCLTWGVGVMSLSWEHRKPTWFLLGFLTTHIGAVTVAIRNDASPFPLPDGALSREGGSGKRGASGKRMLEATP
jgi:hypothetical protein